MSPTVQPSITTDDGMSRELVTAPSPNLNLHITTIVHPGTPLIKTSITTIADISSVDQPTEPELAKETDTHGKF